MRATDGRLFFADLCPIFLDEVSPSFATVEPTSCDITNADGVPIHVEVVSGSITRTGTTISGTYSTQAESPTECITVRSDFDAMRL